VNNLQSEATQTYLAALDATKGCAVPCLAVVCIEPEAATCVRTSAGSSAGRCRISEISIQPF
jgi:hypothetical protein